MSSRDYENVKNKSLSFIHKCCKNRKVVEGEAKMKKERKKEETTTMRSEVLSKIQGSSHYNVTLNGMKITDEEIGEVCQLIIAERPNIRALFLDNNLIGDEGAKTLARLLPRLTLFLT